jgi:hypothetical protein
MRRFFLCHLTPIRPDMLRAIPYRYGEGDLIAEAMGSPMATSNSPTYGRPNSPGQDALIIS